MYDHEKFTPADILGKIQDYHITSLCAPPTIYRFLIKEDISKYDLSSFDYLKAIQLNHSQVQTIRDNYIHNKLNRHIPNWRQKLKRRQ